VTARPSSARITSGAVTARGAGLRRPGSFGIARNAALSELRRSDCDGPPPASGAERRSLLRRLERADTDAEAQALRRRLDLVAGEINGLRALRLRTDYAVVLVALLAAEGAGAGAGAGGSLDDAIGDAGDLLVGTAGVLIRVLALALPIVLLAAWRPRSSPRSRPARPPARGPAPRT
jgi:hypothetical protein